MSLIIEYVYSMYCILIIEKWRVDNQLSAGTYSLQSLYGIEYHNHLNSHYLKYKYVIHLYTYSPAVDWCKQWLPSASHMPALIVNTTIPVPVQRFMAVVNF